MFLIGSEAAQLSHVHLTGNDCPPCVPPQLSGFHLISQMLFVLQSPGKGHKNLPALENLSIPGYFSLPSLLISLGEFLLFRASHIRVLSHLLIISNNETVMRVTLRISSPQSARQGALLHVAGVEAAPE